MIINIYVENERLTPSRAHATDAGMDLRAADDHCISIGSTVEISSGVHAEIPVGFFGLLALRSSLSRRDLIMPNGVGIIDSDYRGAIKIPLKNTGIKLEQIQAGDRIAQLILIPCIMPDLKIVGSLEELTNTSRGAGGFGSTGR